MKQEQKKYLLYAVLILLGVLVGYFLFGGSNLINGGSSSGCSLVVTTTPPVTEGDRVCTKVCVPRPDDCPRQCPLGYHWECSGTLAMNCGCVKDPVTPTNPEEVLDATGPRGCIENPSICGAGYYCDTGYNQCKLTVG